MKRTPPSRLVCSPGPTDTVASAPPHPPTWDYPSEIPRTGYLGTMLYTVALLLALPLYGLAVLSINLFYDGRGLPSIHTKVLEDPLVLTLMFVSALVAMGVIRWLAAGPEVLGFCFDEGQQCLTFTQRRPAREASEVCVPYSAIHSIRPYMANAFANGCHFEVCFAGDNGKPIERRFWVHVPVQDMAFHAAWLRQSVGERMHEVVDLDL